MKFDDRNLRENPNNYEKNEMQVQKPREKFKTITSKTYCSDKNRMENSNNYEQNEMQLQKPREKFKKLRAKRTAVTKTA